MNIIEHHNISTTFSHILTECTVPFESHSAHADQTDLRFAEHVASSPTFLATKPGQPVSEKLVEVRGR